MLGHQNSSVAGFSTQEHIHLLKKASSDDSFRAEMSSNPEAVLARFGIQLDPRDVPSHVQLPGKEVIASQLAVEDEPDDIASFWAGLLF